MSSETELFEAKKAFYAQLGRTIAFCFFSTAENLEGMNTLLEEMLDSFKGVVAVITKVRRSRDAEWIRSSTQRAAEGINMVESIEAQLGSPGENIESVSIVKLADRLQFFLDGLGTGNEVVVASALAAARHAHAAGNTPEQWLTALLPFVTAIWGRKVDGDKLALALFDLGVRAEEMHERGRAQRRH